MCRFLRNSQWLSVGLLLLASLLVCGSVLTRTSRAADEWPQFRGPDGTGHVPGPPVAVHWSESRNIAWKTPIPGKGHSSPVISDNRIWLTTAIEETLSPEDVARRLAQVKNPRGLDVAARVTLQLVSLNRSTGAVEHVIDLFQIDDPEPVHSLNSYASPTPVLEGGRVYCHFGTYGTVCLDTESTEILWVRDDVHVDHQNGPGSSPILWQNLLIVHFDGIDAQFIMAFDKHTGETVWSRKRSGKMNERPEMQKAYCTPVITESNGHQALISPAADWVYAYDPASGEELWKVPYGQLGFSTVPRPVVGHGLVFVCTSFIQSRLLAVKLDQPPGANPVAWYSDSQIPKKPSVLLVEDKLYFVNDGGIATCLDATTGREVWRARLGGQYSASPLYAGGLIYFFSQEGVTTVIRPGATFDVVAENELDEGFMASPAVVDGRLYLRTDGHLYCVRPGASAE